MDFAITLNLQILLTDTFMWMLFHPKPHLNITAFKIKPALATALRDGDGLPAPHRTTKWTVGNEQWFKTATNSQNFSLARQGEETGCALQTTRLKTVSCQKTSHTGYKPCLVPAGGRQA